MLTRIIHWLVLAGLCAAGGALQWQEHFVLSHYRSVPGFLAALFPYVLCIVIGWRSESPLPAAAGAAFALLVDGIAHYDVFVRPIGLSAHLPFLFVPLLSTLIFVPLVILIARALLRRHEAKRAAREEAREERPPRKLEPRMR